MPGLMAGDHTGATSDGDSPHQPQFTASGAPSTAVITGDDTPIRGR